MFEYLMPLLVMRSYPETLLDESCRMVACEFSTKLKPNQPPATYRVGIHRICQAHAMTPQAALDAARKAMVAHLGRCRT